MIITSCRFRQVPTKEKEFAYITGFSSNVYKTISAAEATTSFYYKHSSFLRFYPALGLKIAPILLLRHLEP